MTQGKPLAIAGIEREKLLIALQMHDMVGGLNLAMRVRKLVFSLDYTQDHFPRLYVGMPGVKPEQFMRLDPRKHACYIMPPSNKELFVAVSDITERLFKLGGRLALTGDKPTQGPRRCVLQIYVDGARNIALTLMSTTKGNIKYDRDFQLPNGETP